MSVDQCLSWLGGAALRGTFGCIVEGDGEGEALPVLLRRIAQAVDPSLAVTAPRPIRIPKDQLLRAGDLERAVTLAVRNIGERGVVLVLIDGDDHSDCPAVLGPALRNRAQTVRPALPMSAVVAKREFECWFLAAAESLRGFHGLPNDLAAPANPERIRGAKEWIRNQQIRGQTRE